MPTVERAIAVAVSRYRVPGCTREDLEQEAHLVVLQVRGDYDPARHGDSLHGYLVVCIRRHLSRLCARAVRARAGRLPEDVRSREMSPADSAVFAEELARPRNAQGRVLQTAR